MFALCRACDSLTL